MEFINKFLDNYSFQKRISYRESIRALNNFEVYFKKDFDGNKLKFYQDNYPDCFDKAVEELEKQYNKDLKDFIEYYKKSKKGDTNDGTPFGIIGDTLRLIGL